MPLCQSEMGPEPQSPTSDLISLDGSASPVAFRWPPVVMWQHRLVTRISTRMSKNLFCDEEMEAPRGSETKRGVLGAYTGDSEVELGLVKRARNDTAGFSSLERAKTEHVATSDLGRRPLQQLYAHDIHSTSFIGVRWSQIKGKWRYSI